MTYYNSTTKQFYRGGALKTANGTIFNPTEATLKAHGYEVYTPPTVEPIKVEPSELRRMAYEAECDPLLPSIQSYALQGKTEQLEAVKAKWYARHKAIEARYPDEVTQ